MMLAAGGVGLKVGILWFLAQLKRQLDDNCVALERELGIITAEQFSTSKELKVCLLIIADGVSGETELPLRELVTT